MLYIVKDMFVKNWPRNIFLIRGKQFPFSFHESISIVTAES